MFVYKLKSNRNFKHLGKKFKNIETTSNGPLEHFFECSNHLNRQSKQSAFFTKKKKKILSFKPVKVNSDNLNP